MKSKGISAERELIHKFWHRAWAAIRIAGSGSTKYPAPDILAGNNIRKIGLECKVTKTKYQHFTDKEIEELQEFCKVFGAESWIGIKFNHVDWFFLTLEDLNKTKENYSINLEKAKLRGLSFDEMVEQN